MRKAFPFFLIAASVFLSSAALLPAQVPARISGGIDDTRRATLSGNVHRLARAEFDQGVAPSDLPMERMQLVLTRSADQEAALTKLIEQQHDSSSPSFHQWLTPAQIGKQFGVADQDVQQITGWLQSHGFSIGRVANARTFIEFSGTAAQVQETFHTEIHKYVVNGQAYWANSKDVQIPAALVGVVKGISTLHNFGKKPQSFKAQGEFGATSSAGSSVPQYTSTSGEHALSPYDYSVIYNLNPLYAAGITGAGVTVAVVGRTDIRTSDIDDFRSLFGLQANTPQIVVNGTDPGDLGSDEEGEAVLDTTWAGTVAPGATIKLVVSQSTNTADGVDLSEAYIIDNNLADVMTESFGDCEADGYTSAQTAMISTLAQQAAAEGITYLVAAGDSGAEGCDDPTSTSATGPISPNILASTAYTIAVGGTMFDDTANPSLYWASTNNTFRGSALSYIPEVTWNESCSVAQCGSANAALWAGGGGPSAIVTKPAWQTGVTGIPSDGVRDTPDVALTAAGHDPYLLCLDGSCGGAGRIRLSGYGGTSAATPSFAGIMALVVQKTGSRQGQANYVLYKMAAIEDFAPCNGSSSTLSVSTCIFNDITSGNNAVPGEVNYGTSAAEFQAGIGYDMTVGLGSVNVTNLVNDWNTVGAVPNVRINVDAPANGSTVFGLVTATGWAVSDDSSITSVAIAVDNVPYGNATYGGSRSDVCVVYPGRIGCPNVGWSFTLDTNLLANGSHTLSATGRSVTGGVATASTTFTVANWTVSSVRSNIDIPNAQTPALSGVVGFAGWALADEAAISHVPFSIDGVPYGTATYGIPRPDVCAVYANRLGCPNVGWSITLDTRLLTDGVHTLRITPVSADGVTGTSSSSFTVANGSASQISAVIDLPAKGAVLTGPETFAGWAISNTAAVTRVAVLFDGVFYQNATYGTQRPDVCTVFPERAGCPNVGWTLLVDTSMLADGAHTLDVQVFSADRQEATFSQSFNTLNSSTPLPTKVMIDMPSGGSTITGVTTMAGWAVNDNAAVSSVWILVDDVKVGQATYGTVRTDVCAVYPGRAGCPNVGWSYVLDTTALANGPHTLTALATAAIPNSAESATKSITITVSNGTSPNPLHLVVDTPTASTSESGVVLMAGWALDDLARIQSVTVSIDGISYGAAQYGIPRPDVCAVYPGRLNCPNVGWQIQVDTNFLADGKHTLAITATTTTGRQTTLSTSFTVANAGKTQVLANIDIPAANGTLSGSTALLAGWALRSAQGGSSAVVTSVEILVDGVHQGYATLHEYRPDVCQVYSSAGCPNVGWQYVLDTTQLSNGTHMLEARVTASDGQEGTVSTTFNAAN